MGVRMELLLPVPGCGKLPINLCEDCYDKSFHLLSVHVPSTGMNSVMLNGPVMSAVSGNILLCCKSYALYKLQ